MGWRYQARKKTYNGEVQFELVEAYPDLMEKGDAIIPHTEVAVTISAGTKEDLAKWLRQAADDVEKYEVAVTINAGTKEDLAKWLRQAADDVEKYDVIEGDK
jgi:hypothetical protein